MKKHTKSFALIAVISLLMGIGLSSCGLGKKLRGDPRKNCNHPKHGEYMQQKQMERMGLAPKGGKVKN